MAEDTQPPEEEKDVPQEEPAQDAQPAAEPSDSAAPEEEGTPEDAPAKEKEEEIDEVTTLHERTIAALSYFGFLAIVPFYLKKDSKFCRFHGKQGMTLAIIFFLLKFVSVLDLIMDLALILQAIVALWMGFAALSGKWKKFPWIYERSCQLEEQLSLKTKEEEAEAAALKPNQVKVEEEAVIPEDQAEK